MHEISLIRILICDLKTVETTLRLETYNVSLLLFLLT